MCTRRTKLALILALMAEDEDGLLSDAWQDVDREKALEALPGGVEKRKKALRTLLDEYPPGTRRVLPEDRPYGRGGILSVSVEG